MDNFLEIKDVAEANRVNLKDYTFVRYSDKRDCYIFKLRERK